MPPASHPHFALYYYADKVDADLAWLCLCAQCNRRFNSIRTDLSHCCYVCYAISAFIQAYYAALSVRL